MPDQSDPIDLKPDDTTAEAGGIEKETRLAELRELVGQYEQVKDLVLQPGWPVLITALEKRSAFWKARSMELLESILLKNDGSNSSAFTDARVLYLGTEEAINILLVMRVDAKDAQDSLDRIGAAVRDSNQNG